MGSSMSVPNVQYNSALRQSKAIRNDLEKLSSSAAQPAALTPAEIGNVSASLASFSKTIDEYNSLARQELVKKKQDEAYDRLKRFRDDLADFRSQVESLKKAREDAVYTTNRSELLGRRAYVTSTPENPYANVAKPSSSSSSAFHSRAAPAGGQAGSGLSMGGNDVTREQHALREQNFFANTNSALDEYIARGQAVLGDLGTQREMLKNTQKRLYSVGNTLGISGDTIRMIERRAKEDKWIFWAGVIVFFLFCWACIHFLR
ncbi:vesicle transport V-SNARE protein [Colletotrichum zoysiae]|uniref:Protein transport protein BOS1 n=1 Tax=Colletotrichum zoysiae TaxID=1216348 RepID=A0AAD9HMA2_9PEZI|nr:vesicle transport V-SNARE protein [Colletotrichum zoysiae]